ncbi:hypothetical protein Pcinc_033472 [Petrolisthes cinctipes]|uniref:Uncharacterized protein n=1 Tax=Petrolisthes cinctipes TaxID=88211 RepID=A0AAE1JXC3_PETCI|nr:hypothetical protein Pcinc_033472 [Petrolisthes cinctipes]
MAKHLSIVFLIAVISVFIMVSDGVTRQCPSLELENGRVQYRSRGRVAKFKCRRGFSRVEGDRFATCVRNRWNGLIPKCIRRGCPTIEPPPFGTRTYMFRRAMVAFTCHPGYERHGSPAVTCNSRYWNNSLPICVPPSSPELSCDFEDGMCGWINSNQDDFDWIRKRGPSQDLVGGTGPWADHTLGTDEGALNVYVKTDDESVNFLPPTLQISGSSDARWYYQHVNITSFYTDFQVVLEAVRSPENSDVAIDDVRLGFGLECSPVTTTTTTTTTTTPSTTTTTTNTTATTTTSFTTTTAPPTVSSTISYESSEVVNISGYFTSELFMNESYTTENAEVMTTIIEGAANSTILPTDLPTSSAYAATTTMFPTTTLPPTPTNTTPIIQSTLTTAPGTAPFYTDNKTPAAFTHGFSSSTFNISPLVSSTTIGTPTTSPSTDADAPLTTVTSNTTTSSAYTLATTATTLATTTLTDTPSTTAITTATTAVTTPKITPTNTDTTLSATDVPSTTPTETSAASAITSNTKTTFPITSLPITYTSTTAAASTPKTKYTLATTTPTTTTTPSSMSSVTVNEKTISMTTIAAAAEATTTTTTTEYNQTRTSKKLNHSGDGLSMVAIIAISIVVVTSVVFIAVLLYVYRFRKQDELAEDSDIRHLANDETWANQSPAPIPVDQSEPSTNTSGPISVQHLFVYIMTSQFSRRENTCEKRMSAKQDEDGGWVTKPEDRVALPGPCTITVVDNTLSQEEFLIKYAYNEPVVIKGATDSKVFRSLTRRSPLMDGYGHTTIRLSSANSYSYEKQDVTFEEYCTSHLNPQRLSTFGNETFYFFGDNNSEEWEDLLDLYELPPYTLPFHTSALSFGLAGPGTGVPFHFHGPGFAETLWGRKRWFMYPPDVNPSFHPNRTTLQWLLQDYPVQKNNPAFTECTLGPGEIIYFPDKWWHATLNIDSSVFISTFLSP